MLYPTWLVWPGPAARPARPVALLGRDEAAWLVARAAEGQARRLGLGQGIFDQVSSGRIVDTLIRELTPRLSSLVAEISQAAEPTIRTVVREELAPKVGMYAAVGLLTAGVISGIVGAYFASRSRPAA